MSTNNKPILFQINVVANWGSTGRIAEEIGELAIDNGWDSYIAYGREKKTKSHSNLIKIGNKWDMIIHGIQSRLFDKHGLSSKRATQKLIKQIETIQPDIIHLHNLHGYYLNYPLLMEYLSKTNIPIVWTLHDCWAFTGHCSHYMTVNCNRWKKQCFNCPLSKTYPTAFFIDRSKKNYDSKNKYFNLQKKHLIPVSYWLASDLKSSLLKSHNIDVIHNGIDIMTFTPNENIVYNKNDDESFIILGVCSIWTERKGLLDFIKLSQLLPQQYTIILIGLTHKQISKLPRNIIGIERTNSLQELVKYYNEADVFLNLTYEDNFPTTNIEALACGTPVITYRTGGSPEAIDELTGIVVNQGDINGIINAIKTIKERGKKLYKTACRERAVKLFNKKECYQKYLNLYNELINK